VRHHEQTLDDGDFDFLQPPVIQLNNLDYYSAVTVVSLLKILRDPSLEAHHARSLQALDLIIANLK
jgi:hypothetical protein